MSGYIYLRDKIWTPSGRVVLSPLVDQCLNALLQGTSKITNSTLAQDAKSGKYIAINGSFVLSDNTYEIDCIGISSLNSIDSASASGDVTIIKLAEAISGPMPVGTPITITEYIPAAKIPNGTHISIETISANDPSNFEMVLTAVKQLTQANGNYAKIKFTQADAEAVTSFLNRSTVFQVTLKGFANLSDRVSLDYALTSKTGANLVPEWDLVLPTSKELKDQVQITPYDVNIKASSLTQALDVR